MSELSEVEEAIGVTFTDKSLLQRALMHSSYLNEHPELPLVDNERLEFLGDAVLDFITGEYLYHHFPEMQEGSMTSLRAALVKRETLARFALQIGLEEHLLLGHGEVESGGRRRPATLCAALEALIGAIYLDKGLGVVRGFVEQLIEPEVERVLRYDLDKDPKSVLQELSQARFQFTPHYRTVAQYGPDHAREFIVEVLIGDQAWGRGAGRSKQSAEQSAARDALRALGEVSAVSAEEPSALVSEEIM